MFTYRVGGRRGGGAGRASKRVPSEGGCGLSPPHMDLGQPAGSLRGSVYGLASLVHDHRNHRECGDRVRPPPPYPRVEPEAE